MGQIIIVTGGSSGIGLAVTAALRGKGCTVYELSRRPSDDPYHISADVTDEAAVRRAVQDVIAREGRLDVMICNAGFGISGAMEFTDSADAHRLIEVNLFGMANAAVAALHPMREAGKGRIVCVSSMAGPFPIPFQAWYSISKAAVSAMTMALANEVAPFGVQVCDVMPGDIRTGFTAARRKDETGDDLYGGRIRRSVARMEKDETTGMSPEAAAKTIVRVALKKGRVRPHYAIGASYKLLAVAGKLLPGGVVRWALRLMYAR